MSKGRHPEIKAAYFWTLFKREGGGTVGQQVCITSQGKKSNFGPKALRKEFSRPNMRQKCGNSSYSVHQWIGNWILPHFDPKISSLGLLEAKIIAKWSTPGSYYHCCDFCGGGTMGCHPMLTKNANFVINAIKDDLSTVNVRNWCGHHTYSLHQCSRLEIEFYPNLTPEWVL